MTKSSGPNPFPGTTGVTCEIFANLVRKVSGSGYPYDLCGFLLESYRKLRGVFWTVEKKLSATPLKAGTTNISHTHTVVRECCKGGDQNQWRRSNFDPAQPLSPLTDLHQNWQRWLGRGYLPPFKILFRSDEGFRFRAWATSRTIGDSAIFLGF